MKGIFFNITDLMNEVLLKFALTYRNYQFNE